MVPTFCIDCNNIYARIDNNLFTSHNADKSDKKYREMKDHLTTETERFLHATHDFNKFKYKTTIGFNFRNGKIY